MHKKMFPAALDSLHEMLSFIQAYCEQEEIEADLINKIVLAAEEAIVNIIHHGYPKYKGIIEIHCEKCPHRPGVKITIKDQGIPFNPMEIIEKIKEKQYEPDEDQSLGGYGIFLYVEIMDHVEYQRNDGINILHLIKYL